MADDTTRDRLTQDEARTRAGQISNVTYRLDLDLEAGAKTFRGDVTIGFDHRGGDTFLEWLGGQVHLMEVNGERVEPVTAGSRILLAGSQLGDHNEIRISYERAYDHTGEGLHQFIDPSDGAEYLYTQFEPYSAHRVMPCFDQPDLKATYELTITAPDRMGGGDRRRRVWTARRSPGGAAAGSSPRRRPSAPTCSRSSPGPTPRFTTSTVGSPWGCTLGRR